MEVKVLGMGCPKCKRLEAMAREVAAELGVEATFTKVQDMDAILAYDVATTPALVVDEQVKVSGRLPSKDEIRSWLKGSQ
jgi:small redox-active disulfide protein 2